LLKIDLEYEALCSPLSEAAYRSLKESIRRNGQYEKIIVNPQLVILDGHHRYRACMELGVDPEYEVKSLTFKLDEKIYVVETNLLRRHLNDYQKVEMTQPLEGFYEEKAKQRQGRRTDLTSVSNGTEVEWGRAVDKIARRIGMSSTNYYRAKAIRDRGSDELKELVRSGRKAVTPVYNMLRVKENQQAAKEQGSPPLPDGVHDVIYADPPWKYYWGGSTRGKADVHYPTMTTEEIAALPVKPCIADDAALFLWATNPILEDALTVMESWGFDYKTNIAWVKEKMGTGFYVRSQHELLLIGIRGHIGVPADEDRLPSVIHAPAERHSEKPKEVYVRIERMYPKRRYLELFARETRPGWTSWGNEV